MDNFVAKTDLIEEKDQKSFKIVNLEGADWAFRKIAEIKDQLQKDKDYAEKQILKYQNFISNQEKTANSSMEYFEYLIENYLREELEKNPKFKLKTAVGSATIRKTKKWNYKDKEVIEFLKNNNMKEFIRFKEEVNKTDLKKELIQIDGFAATKDGEIIKGIEIEDKETVIIKAE